MKIDMSADAVAKRLDAVNQLRFACLSLANSSAGRQAIRKIVKKKKYHPLQHLVE